MNAETRAKEIGMTPEQRARDLMANAIPDGMDEASFGELDEYLHTRIASAIRQAERDARVQTLTSVRDAIDRSDSANDYPAWKSEALIVDMINALILLEKD